MIYNAGDYKYVTGDLAKIVINGGIMPLRSKPQIMRGEDIIFLMESFNERLKLHNDYDYSSVFSRKVEFLPVYNLVSGFQHLGSNREWVKPSYAFGGKISVNRSFIDTYADCPVDDIVSNTANVSTTPTMSVISDMFSDAKKLTKTWKLETVPESTSTYSREEFIDDPSESGAHYTPPEWSGDCYYYNMIAWGNDVDLPCGAVLYKQTGQFVSAQNTCAKGIQLIGEFRVSYSAYSGISEEWQKYVFVPIKYSSSDSVAINSNDIFNACQSCLGVLGVSKWPYPGRQGDFTSQEIKVSLMQVYSVRTLRDRTLWD